MKKALFLIPERSNALFPRKRKREIPRKGERTGYLWMSGRETKAPGRRVARAGKASVEIALVMIRDAHAGGYPGHPRHEVMA